MRDQEESVEVRLGVPGSQTDAEVYYKGAGGVVTRGFYVPPNKAPIQLFKWETRDGDVGGDIGVCLPVTSSFCFHYYYYYYYYYYNEPLPYSDSQRSRL